MHDIIIQAINEKKVVKFDYHGFDRVENHDNSLKKKCILSFSDCGSATRSKTMIIEFNNFFFINCLYYNIMHGIV